MIGKQRLSATVDADLLAAAERAAASGSAKTISAWVNDALRLKLEHDRRLEALAAFIAEREAERGVITEADMERATRSMSARARVVRGSRTRAGRAAKR
jgi:hypothetical protein